jgi:4-diphosphocytidyl-2-C-methyl-D-erythritol kinase
MIQFPNCKINLGLNIIGKRPDGFHNIETLLYPVELHDALEIVHAPDGVLKFQTTGLVIPGEPEQNLCLRAFKLLESDFGLPAVNIHLLKAIPMGSGLGGGSADGAYTLRILNDLFGLGLGSERLMHYARQLGSDCAFFIENYPVFAFDKGGEFESIHIDLTGYYISIVIPAIHVSTAEAYGMVEPEVSERSLLDIPRIPMKDWRDILVNDFEKQVFAKYPLIGGIKAKLYEHGAVYASMSGSGSAVYGIFTERPQIEGLFPGCFLWISKPAR